MAALYKYVPVYYSKDIGLVGGLVGMVGGLGGFFLAIAFGIMNDLTGVWTSCFMLLLAIVTFALLWMHFSVHEMERVALPETLRGQRQLFLSLATIRIFVFLPVPSRCFCDGCWA